MPARLASGGKTGMLEVGKKSIARGRFGLVVRIRLPFFRHYKSQNFYVLADHFCRQTQGKFSFRRDHDLPNHSIGFS